MMKSTRAYDNRRRAAQAADTRARIVDAALALLAEGTDALTIPAIAARAAVSVPTVYRYFPTREELLAAIDAVLVASLGPAPDFGAPDQLPAQVQALHLRFGAHVDRIRAAAHRPAFDEVRTAGRRVRDRALAQALAPVTAGLPTDDAHALVAVVRLLMGTEAFLILHDRFALSPEATGKVCAWAVEALCRAAAAGPIQPSEVR